MFRFINWLAGWRETRRIKKFNPGLYEFLKNYVYDPDDFVEVPVEGQTKLRIHKDALENLRQLGISKEDILPNKGRCDCPPDTRGDACNGNCKR
jgi:hypothetical protein